MEDAVAPPRFDAGKKRPTGWRPLEIRSRRLSVSPYVLQETNGSVKFRPAEPVEVGQRDRRATRSARTRAKRIGRAM